MKIKKNWQNKRKEKKKEKKINNFCGICVYGWFVLFFLVCFSGFFWLPTNMMLPMVLMATITQDTTCFIFFHFHFIINNNRNNIKNGQFNKKE